jgi:nitrate reductase NapE component
VLLIHYIDHSLAMSYMSILLSSHITTTRSSFSLSSSSIHFPTISGRIHYKTTYACEGKQLDLSCDEGKMIHLVRANYGRFSLSICNPTGQLDLSVNCMSFRSFLIMQDRCSQSSNCSVVVSSKIFGDPCPGTSKYLEVQYHCVHPSAVGTPDSPTIVEQSTRKPDPGRDFMTMVYTEPLKPSAAAAAGSDSAPAAAPAASGETGSNDLTGIRAPYETTSMSAHSSIINSTSASSVLQVPAASPVPMPAATSTPGIVVPNISASSRIATTASSSISGRRNNYNNEETSRILNSMMTSGAPTRSHHAHHHQRPHVSPADILKFSNQNPIPPRPEINLPSWLEPSVNPTSAGMDVSSRPLGPDPDMFTPESESGDQMSHPSADGAEDDDMILMAIGLFFIVFFAVMGTFGLIYWMFFKSENMRVRKFVRSIPLITCILGPDPELDMDSEKVSSVVQSSAYGTTTMASNAGFPIVQTRVPTQIMSTDSPNNKCMTLGHQYHQHQLQQQQLLNQQMMQTGNGLTSPVRLYNVSTGIAWFLIFFFDIIFCSLLLLLSLTVSLILESIF